MIFADRQQRIDFLAGLRRLRMLAMHHELNPTRVDDLTLEELGERIAELRNIEQVLLNVYREREESASSAAKAAAEAPPWPCTACESEPTAVTPCPCNHAPCIHDRNRRIAELERERKAGS